MSKNKNFGYNHEVWAKYSFIELGIDMYRAKYQASIPKRPIKIAIGKWFVDCRVFKWQVIINKMTKEQVARTKLSFEWEQRQKQQDFDNPGNFSF
jgi:hypothetical protein